VSFSSASFLFSSARSFLSSSLSSSNSSFSSASSFLNSALGAADAAQLLVIQHSQLLQSGSLPDRACSLQGIQDLVMQQASLFYPTLHNSSSSTQLQPGCAGWDLSKMLPGPLSGYVHGGGMPTSTPEERTASPMM
jgi:hypothetical protein